MRDGGIEVTDSKSRVCKEADLGLGSFM